jgi:hypothetical protein
MTSTPQRRSAGRIAIFLIAIILGTGLVSAPAQAAPFSVTARLNTPTLTLGYRATITGTVGPSSPGRAVELWNYNFTSKKYVKISTRYLSPTSTYTFSVAPSRIGNYYFRVCKPATGSTARGCSATLKLSVYRWSYLSDLSWVDYSGDWDEGETLGINGTTHTKSLRLDAGGWDDDSGWIEYNLSRRCLTLDMTAGVTDTSASGTSMYLEVLVDSGIRHTSTHNLGSSQRVILKIPTGLRLRIQWTQLGSAGSLGLGGARIYCQF